MPKHLSEPYRKMPIYRMHSDDCGEQATYNADRAAKKLDKDYRLRD